MWNGRRLGEPQVSAPLQSTGGDRAALNPFPHTLTTALACTTPHRTSQPHPATRTQLRPPQWRLKTMEMDDGNDSKGTDEAPYKANDL